MPLEWITRTEQAPEQSGACFPVAELHLWPHRSLTAKGFVWFIGITATALSLPLFAVLGTAVLWGLLPFMLLVLGGVWYGIRRNQRDLSLHEVLVLDVGLIDVIEEVGALAGLSAVFFLLGGWRFSRLHHRFVHWAGS